jgi:hypothetical protein
MTGNFMWVDFTPPGGGASELGAALTGDGVCNLPALGSEVGEAGVVSSLAAQWNSRFGIYKGSVQSGDSHPDYTGYAYVPGKDGVPAAPILPTQVIGKFADFTNKRGTYTPYQGDAATGLNTGGGSQASTSTYHQSDGRDRRMATVAVVNCPGFTSGTTAPVTKWACVLMLHPLNGSVGGSGTGTGTDRMYLEFLGMSDDEDSPCATSGIPAGPGGAGPMVPALVQ